MGVYSLRKQLLICSSALGPTFDVSVGIHLLHASFSNNPSTGTGGSYHFVLIPGFLEEHAKAVEGHRFLDGAPGDELIGDLSGKNLRSGTPSRLGGDGGGFAMTGIDVGLGRQGEKEVERVHKLGIVATGEVGTAVAHFKERVAGEEDFVLGEIETHRAGSMAGGLEQLEIAYLRFLIFDF